MKKGICVCYNGNEVEVSEPLINQILAEQEAKNPIGQFKALLKKHLALRGEPTGTIFGIYDDWNNISGCGIYMEGKNLHIELPRANREWFFAVMGAAEEFCKPNPGDSRRYIRYPETSPSFKNTELVLIVK